MNRTLRTVMTCAAVYMLSFGLAAAVTGEGSRPDEAVTAGADMSVVDMSAKSGSYIVKEHNGVVAVFLKGEETPTVETDIFVSGLRARDRELLERGIEKESYTEVLCLLEDLDS